jgi:hypothetical protein
MRLFLRVVTVGPTREAIDSLVTPPVFLCSQRKWSRTKAQSAVFESAQYGLCTRCGYALCALCLVVGSAVWHHA